MYNALLRKLLRLFNKTFHQNHWNTIRQELGDALASSKGIGALVKLNEVMDAIIAFKQNEKQSTQKAGQDILLAICELAFLFEENGNPIEHALKLSVVFDRVEEALKYLERSGTHAESTQQLLVHAACLFSLPDISQLREQNWSKWKALFKNEVLHRGNRKFLRVFANAVEIERFLYAPGEDGKVPYKSPPSDALKTLEKERNSAHQEYKKLHRRHGRLNASESERYDKLVKDILPTLHSKLAHAARSLQFTHMTYSILHVCDIYCTPQDGIAKYLHHLGLGTQSYEKFKRLKRQDDQDMIPDITIDGEKHGYKGYYLMKVPVLHDGHAARAAGLGKLTDCCQSLSGELGEACTIHGLCSPYGGFYVLCEGETNAPLDDKIQHPVLAQTWIWRSQKKALVFDSIEVNKERTKHKSQKEMVITLFHQLAKKLVTGGHTHKVTCGAYSGISWHFGLDESKPERFIDYDAYHDSARQYILVDADRPFIFYHCDPHFRNETEQRILQNLQGKEAISQNCFLTQLINWALLHQQETLLVDLETFSATVGRKDEIINLIGLMQNYLNGEMRLREVFTHMTQHTLPISIVNHENNTILHLLTPEGPDLLKAILEPFPASQKRKALAAENNDGNTVWHLAAHSNINSLKSLLHHFPKSQRLEQLTVQNNDGFTVLHLAAQRNTYSLKTILEQLPEEQRLSVLQTKDKNGNTVIHSSVYLNAYSLKVIMETLPIHQRLAALKLQNIDGNTVLHQIVPRSNPESLAIIFQQLPEEQRLEALMMEDKNGDTILHLIASHHLDSLVAIVRLIPAALRLAAVTTKNKDDNNLLHLAAMRSDTKALKSFLELLPEAHRAIALNNLNKKGHSALHLAAMRITPDALIAILKRLPAAQRLASLKSVNKNGDMVLHQAAIGIHPDSLLAILELLSDDERLAALTLVNRNGNSVSHLVAKGIHPQSLLCMLQPLSASERYAILTAKNKKGNSVLHLIAMHQNPELLIAILDILSGHEAQLQALQSKNKRGKTVVELATSKHPEALHIILQSLPERKRRAAGKSDDEAAAEQLEGRAPNHEWLTAGHPFFIKQQNKNTGHSGCYTNEGDMESSRPGGHSM
ncbi:MAG: hypothetical protein JJT82_00515 [Legionellaceae bacterium]|nr:hypothetical protein [Legionellaceae bacterium]